jgi:hypothetical protein
MEGDPRVVLCRVRTQLEARGAPAQNGRESDYEHFALLARYKARFDLPDKQGTTAAEIMSRKRDARFKVLATGTLTRGTYAHENAPVASRTRKAKKR